MSFLKKLFSNFDDDSKKQEQRQSSNILNESIYFGRYTDSNKTAKQLDEFKRAKESYKEKRFVESFNHFFNYLIDSTMQNTFFKLNDDLITFEIIQGSKLIKGQGDNNYIAAETKVASFEGKLSVAVMRKLMMLNYNLKYGMFAINNNEIVMKFKSSSKDASPHKLYAGLKEIAINSDKQDDLLINEFENLHSIDQQHIIATSQNEKETKFNYLYKWINETLERVDKLDEAKFVGPISFALLALSYKIDYLLTPEGILTNALEKIQAVYSRKDLDIIQRNYEMKKEFQKVLDIPKGDILGSFYKVKATFGIVAPVNYKQVADFIFEESKKIVSYRQNNEMETVMDIYQYMAGYCLFYWGMYEPVKQLIALYIHICNNDFLKDLGIEANFKDEHGNINKNAINKEINKIIDRGKENFPKLYFNTHYLKYDSMINFSESFFKEIDVLIFTK